MIELIIEFEYNGEDCRTENIIEEELEKKHAK